MLDNQVELQNTNLGTLPELSGLSEARGEQQRLLRNNNPRSGGLLSHTCTDAPRLCESSKPVAVLFMMV